MSAIITDQFRILTAKTFVSTASSGTSSYYAFIGLPNSNEIDPNWNISPPTPKDSFEQENTTWDTIIALKKILPSDVRQVIRKIVWESGITYDMYRHDISRTNPSKPSGALSLYESNYYVINSEYRVYICLQNGTNPENPEGRPSLDEPTFTDLEPRSAGTSGDGYIWKYLYTLSPSEIIKFDSINYIPVPANWETNTENSLVRNNAQNGGQIKVVNIKNRGIGIGTGNSIYTNVSIDGDGSGGEVTIIVNNNSQIESVTVSNGGSGYTFGTINLSSAGIPEGTSSPEFDVIIPPLGGHGYDIYRELGAYYVSLYTKFENDNENPDFITGNEVSRVGIVENPLNFDSTAVLTEDKISAAYALKLIGINAQDEFKTTSFIPDSFITQTIGTGVTAVGRVISYDNQSGILKYWLDKTTAGFNTDGTFNPSSCWSVAFFIGRKVVGTTVWQFGSLWLMDKTIIAGGNSNEPIGIESIVKTIADSHERKSAILQGVKQMLLLQDLQIGDGGSSPTYLDLDGTAIEFPSQYNRSTKNVSYNSVDNKIGITYYAGSSDTIKHRNSVISSPSRYKWGFDASSSSGATYDFSGLSVIGAGTITMNNRITFDTLTINDYSTISASGATFLNSTFLNVPSSNDSISISSGTTFTGCTINVSRVTAGNYWVSTPSPTGFTNCSFIGGGGHAIRITSGGTYSFVGNTFSGFGASGTTGAAIYNDSGGLVTINISGGGDTPTFRNGTSASTVINNSVTDFDNCYTSTNAIPFIDKITKEKKVIFPKKPSRTDKGRVYLISTDVIKDMLYGWLRVAGNYDEPTPGYAHFPEERDAEYFIQLTAEKRKTKYRRGSGVPIRIWVLKHGVRNEALDCRVYAIAAKYGLNVPIEAVRKRNAKILQAQSEMEESADAVAKKKSRRPIKNKFMREITSL